MSARPRAPFRGSMYTPFAGGYNGGASGYDYSSYYGYGGAYGVQVPAVPSLVAAAVASKAKSHTSSTDPKAIKSRVFVGNLNTQITAREQLEMLYSKFGQVVGLSMHKGYAFIQYMSEAQARNAVSFTDGMTIAGQVLDVNIADEPKDRKGEPKPVTPSGGFGGTQSKRSRFDAGLDIMEQIEPEIINYAGYEDTLKCGHCGSVFRSWEKFREHRTSPCLRKEVNGNDTDMKDSKPDGEPDSICCFICKSSYQNSWNLIQHLAEKHNMTVYSTT